MSGIILVWSVGNNTVDLYQGVSHVIPSEDSRTLPPNLPCRMVAVVAVAMGGTGRGLPAMWHRICSALGSTSSSRRTAGTAGMATFLVRMDAFIEGLSFCVLIIITIKGHSLRKATASSQ